MSKKTLKFDNGDVNKKEFYTSKQPISLDLVNVNQILISDKSKHSDTGFKYFIGYKGDIQYTISLDLYALFYLK